MDNNHTRIFDDASLTRAPVPAVAAVARRRRWVRPLLFTLLPVALIAGTYEYVTGGQVMSTDNAYVQARSVGVTTDVSGLVASVAVRNNQHVRKGDLLFRLRDTALRIALQGAQAQLGTVRNQVLTQQAAYRQALAQIEQARADLPYYTSVFKRQQDLASSVVASRANFDQAQHDLVARYENVTVAQANAQSLLAQLGNDASQPVEDNPFYRQARSAVDAAQHDLDDTVVRAPFDGIVTNVDSLQVGGYLRAAQPGFSLISDDDIWVEASPKETELTHVRPGQRAVVTVDTYPGVAWRGTVESLSPASGSSFSLLPAQNTTGNWVKVVQRIPMRVRLDDPGDRAGAHPEDRPPLRVGMSVVVEIDTGHARGLPNALQALLDRIRGRHA